MSDERANIRRIGERLIESCHDPEDFARVLKGLKPREVLEAQVFIWDFLFRLSKDRDLDLSREAITKRMMPTSTYQYNVGCNERLDYCRANICIYTNPVCASNKLRGQLEALRSLLSEQLG